MGRMASGGTVEMHKIELILFAQILANQIHERRTCPRWCINARCEEQDPNSKFDSPSRGVAAHENIYDRYILQGA